MLDFIEIKNFRSCEDVQLRLGDPVVALLGKNGAGKTNLLHAIQLAADLCVGESESVFSLHPRDPSEPTSFGLRFTLDSSKFEYRTRRSAAPTSVQIFEESLTKDSAELFNRSGEETQAAFSGLVAMRFSTRAATLPTLLQILPKDDPAVHKLKPVADFLRSIRYYSLIQGFQEHVVGPQRAMIGEQWSDSSPFIELARYEVWKSELLQGRARRSVQMRLLHLFLEDQDSFAELKSLLGDDGLGLLADIRIEKVKLLRDRVPAIKSDKVEEAAEVAFAISFVPGGGLAGAGRAFRYSGLSAGTWRILQMLTYLVFDKNSCMLLEQPEDSIHPGLLAKVIDILRTYSGRTQLICTTHSPRVMNLVGPEGIRLVTAMDGGTVVESLSDKHLEAAKGYLQDEGTLAEFLDTL